MRSASRSLSKNILKETTELLLVTKNNSMVVSFEVIPTFSHEVVKILWNNYENEGIIWKETR